MTNNAGKSEVGTRLVMGTILAILAAGVLVFDWTIEDEIGSRLYPCLMLCVVGMATLASVEMNSLLAERLRPPIWLTAGGSAAVLLTVWSAHLGWYKEAMRYRSNETMHDVTVTFAFVVLIAFLYEMWKFRGQSSFDPSTVVGLQVRQEAGEQQATGEDSPRSVTTRPLADTVGSLPKTADDLFPDELSQGYGGGGRAVSFREPDRVVVRLALAIFIVAYLGLLPAFLVDLRWWPDDRLKGVTALVLVIFVPKSCDIGAYFTGRAFGRHRMTPYLSPKKTWEGLAGGIALSAVVAVLVHRLMPPVFRGDDVYAATFGVVLGLAGVLGDLAESLIKRDCGKKDAATMLPGFGGVLDVIDSILFAAPVAWVWLRG